MKVARKRLSPSKLKVRRRESLRLQKATISQLAESSTQMRKTPPHTVAIASTKGGSGKSSITAALAVQAAKEGNQVAMLDWEPQGSLTLWWLMRGKSANPYLIRDDLDPATAVRKMAGRCDWLFLDTAPALLDQVELAVESADFHPDPHPSFRLRSDGGAGCRWHLW
jgi:hypothetical protein